MLGHKCDLLSCFLGGRARGRQKYLKPSLLSSSAERGRVSAAPSPMYGEAVMLHWRHSSLPWSRPWLCSPLTALRARSRCPTASRMTGWPQRIPCRCRASTSPTGRATSTGHRRARRACLHLHQGDRRRRPSSMRNSRQNWHGAKNAGIVRGAYHFIYWCRPARRAGAVVHAERAARPRRAAAGARRRMEQRIEDLPAPRLARGRSGEDQDHAGRDAGAYRQAADHLHRPRLLSRRARRGVHQLSLLAALGRGGARGRSTEAARGPSGSSPRRARCRACRAASTATASTAPSATGSACCNGSRRAAKASGGGSLFLASPIPRREFLVGERGGHARSTRSAGFGI